MISNQSDIIEGVTIFEDDSDPAQFYFLPRRPRLATSEDGKPMFTFLRYQFPIEREDQDEPGGGYLVFTTELSEETTHLENRVKPVLSQRLRQAMPLATELPPVKLGPVDFTEGEARLIITRDDGLVRTVNVGRPSFFGDNTVSVAVELPANGATLFYEALARGGSVAAIEYNLRFPVRLPAVTIRAHVSGKEVKEAVMEYTESDVTEGDIWGSETRTERHRTSISETMESQGLVNLTIDKGDADVNDEDMESLRAFAFRSMDEFIKEHFLKGGTVETEEDRRSQWMEFLSQDITASFDMNVSYRDVIKRQYNPSAQVNPSFLGTPVEDVVMEIDLQNAPWYYNTLEVTIDTTMDFDAYDDIVHSVVGHLSYDEMKPDGTRITERKSLSFTASDHTPKEFKTRLAEVGRDEYHVEIEVNYRSGPVSKAVIDRFDTTTRNLTLNIPNPGVIEVDFAVAPQAFSSELKAVEIEVAYADPRNDVPRVVETKILDAETPEDSYRRVIYASWDKPYEYRYTYVLEDEDGNVQRSTTGWLEAGSGTRYQKVPTPFDQHFGLTVLASVDWTDVSQLVVDLEYHDEGNDYRQQTSLAFSSDAAGKKDWKFPLRSPDERAYRYKQTLLMTNGAVQSGDWVDAPSDSQTLVCGNAPGGVVKVVVDPSDVGLGENVKRVVVSLRYEDEENGVLDEESLLFRPGEEGPQEWLIARQDASKSAYSYEVRYFMADDSQQTLEDQSGDVTGLRDFLFLSPPPG